MAKKVYIGVGHGGSDPGAVFGEFKEKYLALDTSRILDVRAAIISDITTDSTLTESWGKYSVATSPDVVSDYKG